MPCSFSEPEGRNKEAFAILVAGGSGSRMGADQPKQFLPLDGKPVLVHTFHRFFHSGLFKDIVVVLPPIHLPAWERIASEFLPQEKFILAEGGETRSESVLNGLKTLQWAKSDDLVAIHDGVRPFVSLPFLRSCLQTASVYGNAIPCTTPPESFRYMDSDSPGETASHAVDRKRIRSIQTPQCFRYGQILEAFEKRKDHGRFTDEASLLEAAGYPVRLCEGLSQNIKITRPFDLHLAGFFLQNGF